MSNRNPRRARPWLWCLLLLSWSAAADDRLWALLARGGQVVLVRHAVTTAGVGDPAGMRVDDCATQRNLIDEGRGQARHTGDAFRARKIPVERVLTSPWCRCMETARLAWNVAAETTPALGNLYGRPENQAAQVRELRTLAGGWRNKGNLILVSHGSTIGALTGVWPEPMEMVIVTPQAPDTFVVAGRLLGYPR